MYRQAKRLQLCHPQRPGTAVFDGCVWEDMVKRGDGVTGNKSGQTKAPVFIPRISPTFAISVAFCLTAVLCCISVNALVCGLDVAAVSVEYVQHFTVTGKMELMILDLSRVGLPLSCKLDHCLQKLNVFLPVTYHNAWWRGSCVCVDRT